MMDKSSFRRQRLASSRSFDATSATSSLLQDAQHGNRDALEVLLARYAPRLRRWAHGRLPQAARGMVDTGDLVQDTLMHAIRRLPSFEERNAGGLQAYLRMGLVNRIRDEVRRVGRRPAGVALDTGVQDVRPSPLEEAIGQEALERYDAALETLRREDREAVLARVEMQLSYEETAALLEKPTVNAARVAVSRAIYRLSEAMSHLEAQGDRATDRHARGSTPRAGSKRREALPARLWDSAVGVADCLETPATPGRESLSADESQFIGQLEIVSQVGRVHQRAATSLDVLPGPQVEPLHEGDRWLHLVIRAQIGAGSYGEVYRAWDSWLERDVALKLLRSFATREEAESALNEALKLARVRDPNVVAVHGADVSEGRVGIWMELVPGQTLADILRADGTFSPADAVAVGREVCRALSAVHDAGLLHRDVTAKNVIRTPEGRVVLTDFGASDAWNSDAGERRRAGTPVYLAPELLDGAPGTVQSDVYAVGVLLYHLLTKEFPVKGDSLDDIRTLHQEGRLSRLRDAGGDIPRSLVNVVDAALAADQSARPRDAREMEAQLAAVFPESKQSLLHASAGNLIEFTERARRGLTARQWLLDRIVTRVIRLRSALPTHHMEELLFSGDWSFDLSPFLASTTSPESLVFLALYPSGLVRSVSVSVAGTLATLDNPMNLLDPRLEDTGQETIDCEVELVGLPDEIDERAT